MALRVDFPGLEGEVALLWLLWLPAVLPFLLPLGEDGETTPVLLGDDDDDDGDVGDDDDAMVLPVAVVNAAVVVVVVSRTVEVHGADVKQTIIASGVPSALPPM